MNSAFGDPRQMFDTRIADLIGAGRIRIAMLPPQYTKDPATGEYTVSVTKVLDQAELLADFWTDKEVA